jgi:hypothetical protein
MALSINPSTKLISVPQSYLTFIGGTLYVLNSNQFRKDVMAILASEEYVWMVDAFLHNTEVTVAGTTFARTLEFINGYSIQFEFTGSQYSVRIEGSNNNIFDVANGILVPTSLVTVISTNSAGLISGETLSERIEMTVKAMYNRQHSNSVTGKFEQYDDTNTTIEYQGDLFMDDARLVPYDGTDDILIRDQMDLVP